MTCWNVMCWIKYLSDFLFNNFCFIVLLIYCLTCPLCKALLFWTCWLAPIFAPDCLATQLLQQTFSSEGIFDNAVKEQFAQKHCLHVCPWGQFYLWGSSEMSGWLRTELRTKNFKAIFHWFLIIITSTRALCAVYTVYMGWLHASGFPTGCLSCLYHPKTCLKAWLLDQWREVWVTGIRHMVLQCLCTNELLGSVLFVEKG